jgi:hypothetical protein
MMVVVGYARANRQNWVLVNDPLVDDAGTNNVIIRYEEYANGPEGQFHWFDSFNVRK